MNKLMQGSMKKEQNKICGKSNLFFQRNIRRYDKYLKKTIGLYQKEIFDI